MSLVGKGLLSSRFLCLNLIFPTRAIVSECFEMWGEAQGKVAAAAVKKKHILEKGIPSLPSLGHLIPFCVIPTFIWMFLEGRLCYKLLRL